MLKRCDSPVVTCILDITSYRPACVCLHASWNYNTPRICTKTWRDAFTNSYQQCRIWGFHSGGYEEYHLLGYDAVQSVELQPTFRRNISPPSSRSKKASTCLLAEIIFWPWRWGRYVPSKRRLQLNRLQGVISQKMILFIMPIYYEWARLTLLLHFDISDDTKSMAICLKNVLFFTIYCSPLADHFICLYYIIKKHHPIHECFKLAEREPGHHSC
jgi:hypothetical protein